MSTKTSLRYLPKKSSFIKHLKADPLIPTIQEAERILNESSSVQSKYFHTPRMIKEGFYAFTVPETPNKIQPLLTSKVGVDLFNIEKDYYFYEITSGKVFHHDKDVFPYAQAYGGSEYQDATESKGDGRVVSLFQVKGLDGKWYEWQIKGAGKTPFAVGDGSLTLSAGIKEFIMSETLHALGIPTSRVLQLTLLPDKEKEMNETEKYVSLARFAENWIRFGSFEKDWNNIGFHMRALANYVIEHVFQIQHETKNTEPKFNESDDQPKSNIYEELFYLMARKNAETMAAWQVYGFLHGNVMTDEINVSGLSMGFSHSSFLCSFDPDYSPRPEDLKHSYSFILQSELVVYWGLLILGGEMLELFSPQFSGKQEGYNNEKQMGNFLRVLRNAEKQYEKSRLESFSKLFGLRLGIENATISDYKHLFEPLLDILKTTGCDYNKFFLKLQDSTIFHHSVFYTDQVRSRINSPKDDDDHMENAKLSLMIEKWFRNYKARLGKTSYSKRREISTKVNPMFLPRSSVVEEVVDSCYANECTDLSLLNKLHRMSCNPFDSNKWGNDLNHKEREWCQDITEKL